jgi:orotate phosphoribosyltransferase
MAALPLLAPPSGHPLAPSAGSSPDDERAELLELLRREAILRLPDDQPVLSRDGSSARWMLDSLAVTLTPRGAELAAHCLLRTLAPFEGRQLATFGLTGVPLLQACLLLGRGRYSGLLVRKERKAHGSLKLIEGRPDTAEPVVMIDDSVSSGHSMLTCARRLEEAGFEVEGGVCLVRFGYDRGTARMLKAGYRAATVFDIYEDFIRVMDGEPDYPLNPTKQALTPARAGRSATEGLHPTVLAREIMAEYLRSGQVLRAPLALDRGYDGAGGCWVSVRRRSQFHHRPARSGFWHFPGEEAGRVACVAAHRRPGSSGPVLARGRRRGRPGRGGGAHAVPRRRVPGARPAGQSAPLSPRGGGQTQLRSVATCAYTSACTRRTAARCSSRQPRSAGRGMGRVRAAAKAAVRDTGSSRPCSWLP